MPAAERVVAFLPIAYGRRLLDGLVELPATFLVGGREHRLTDDPIYAAADHLARTEATKADVGAIGLRSAEVSVVNQALNAGSNPADLLLSPPVLMVNDSVPTTYKTGDAARRSSGSGHLRALMRRLGGGAKSRHPSSPLATPKVWRSG